MTEGKYFKKHITSFVFLILTVFIAGLIFFFSSQGGESSSAESYGISYYISSFIVKGFSKLSEAEKKIKTLELVPYVRKAAHFCIFATLSFFGHLTVISFKTENGCYTDKLKSALGVAAFCIAYALSDELHQLFVSGRDGNFRDVMIDFSGAVLGIIVSFVAALIFFKLSKKYRK